jgi:mRNA interferase MazF
MITSASNRRWSGDVPVSDLDRAGLPAPSVVRTAKIATLEADAASRIGYLEEADRQKVSEKIRRLLHPAGICLPDR